MSAQPLNKLQGFPTESPAPPRRASEAELIHGDLRVYECTALTYWKRDGVERAVTYTVVGTVGK